MVAAIRQHVTVQAGGVIELRSSELQPGSRVEVIVLVEQDPAIIPGKLADFIGAAKGVYADPDAADRFIRAERRMGTITAIVPPTVYLDTNVFIYAVEDFSGVGDKLRSLFMRFDSGELHAVTSELTLAEVLVKPLRDGNTAACDAYTRILQSTPSLTIVPVDRTVLLEAARLRASTSLKLPDAIHAATALSARCKTFLTNDTQLGIVSNLPTLLVSRL